jgi:hypothetical protein
MAFQGFEAFGCETRSLRAGSWRGLWALGLKGDI